MSAPFTKDNCSRHIHLDFHTPEFVRVGDKFDSKQFFDRLQSAEVNSLTAFAHCHHGYSYFSSPATGQMHPGLDFDLLGEMACEAARRQMTFLPYFSMNVNEVQSRLHPEWHALGRDGLSVNSQILQDGTELFWTWLCPNRDAGKLVREFLFPHIKEVLDRYPLDGIFIDMAGYLPGSCFCESCCTKMKQADLDPKNEQDHAAFNALTIQNIAAEVRALLDARQPGLRLQMGGFFSFGEAANADSIISEYYLESLAYQTGWEFFPNAVRYYRNFNLPCLGMTGRFLKNWGDFGTVASAHQLKAQLSMHLMAGVGSAIGDHLHCNGVLNEAVYKTIGEAFKFISERQPYCVGMEPMREAAVLVPGGMATYAAADGEGNSVAASAKQSYTGACKMMQELHLQYDLLAADQDWDLDLFRVITVHHNQLSPAWVEKLRLYVEDGGLLLVSACALTNVNPLSAAAWQDFIGVRSSALSEYDGEYYQPAEKLCREAAIPEMAHYVHARAFDAVFSVEVKPLAQTLRSPNLRSRERHYGHFHGPACNEAGTAIGIKKCGSGHVILLRPQIFSAYLLTGYVVHRQVIAALLEQFGDAQRRTIKTNAPSIVDITVGKKGNKIILQLQPLVADRRYRYSFESLIPLTIHDVWVQFPNLRNGLASDPLTGQKICGQRVDGALRINIPPFAEHCLIEIEPGHDS